MQKDDPPASVIPSYCDPCNRCGIPGFGWMMQWPDGMTFRVCTVCEPAPEGLTSPAPRTEPVPAQPYKVYRLRFELPVVACAADLRTPRHSIQRTYPVIYN